MHGGVRVGTPHALLKGGEQIVIFVALFIVVRAGFGTDLPRAVYRQLPVFSRARHGGTQYAHFADVQRLAHIAAGSFGNVCGQALFYIIGFAALLLQQPEGALHGGQRIRGAHVFELKHRGAAQHGGIDIKIRVLGGGGDQGDISVFNVLQQALLLFFVKILYLVQIQQQPVRGGDGAELGDHVLHVAQRSAGAVEDVQALVGLVCDHPCHRGLAGARGAVEDQVRDLAGFYDVAQRCALAEQMLLPGDLIQGFRADPVRQRN